MKTSNHILCVFIALVAIMGLFAAPAFCNVTYHFGHIVELGDGPTQLADGAIGEAQMSMTVSDHVNNQQVLFTFYNTGFAASSITAIYFDDVLGIFNSMGTIDNTDPGVSFSEGAKPSNLPAGNILSPKFTADFSLDSDSPTQPKGVNPGESVGVFMNLNLTDGFDYAYSLDALNSLQDLRVGIKVQGFASGGSETFVLVPAPGALLLGSIGLGIISCLRRRKCLV